MSKPIFIYQCPVCKTAHIVTSDDIYHSILGNVCHECPVCKRHTVLVYESYYWNDNRPHLNPDIIIMYYEDYLKKVKNLKK